MLTKPYSPIAHGAMDRSVAVRFDNVSKLYKLYADKASRIREAFDPRGRAFHKELHALHDVSFEIARGTTVGILGVNGSGTGGNYGSVGGNWTHEVLVRYRAANDGARGNRHGNEPAR